ncbi:UPF0175 family protein [Chloroflexota bacterium]
MSTNILTIPYSDDLLLSMKRSPREFESEAKLLLAVKLYEMDSVSMGAAARLAGLGRVAFISELASVGWSRSKGVVNCNILLWRAGYHCVVKRKRGSRKSFCQLHACP